MTFHIYICQHTYIDELEALRQNYKDKATTDNARGNKGIQDKNFVNLHTSTQCGGTNPESNKNFASRKQPI